MKIYLDHNATTPVHPDVLSAMQRSYEIDWGNASSIHWAGRGPDAVIAEARERLAALLSCRPGEVVFTSGGTEADNTALRGAVLASQRRHVISSPLEHKAILDTLGFLQRHHRVEVSYLSVDSRGRHDPDELRSLLRPDTALVSVMLANNELGNLNPIAELAALAHEAGALMHTDAVNACGKVPVDVAALGADLVSVSAHKLRGPKGTGALILKRGTRFEALMQGGGQERGRRGGTYNTAGIVGFGVAAELARAWLPVGPARIAALRDRIEARLLDAVSDCVRNGDVEHRLPNTCNLSFAGVDGEALVLNLDLRGIATSTGSACSSGSVGASHVLVALDRDPRWLDGALRLSLGHDTTTAEVDAAAEAVIEEVSRLRALGGW